MPLDELTVTGASQRVDLQEETIHLYCNGIEERIRDAASGNEAQLIAGEACDSFSQACLSDILKDSLQQYVTGLMKKYWISR